MKTEVIYFKGEEEESRTFVRWVKMYESLHGARNVTFDESNESVTVTSH